MANLACDFLRVSDMRVKEINLSLCPSLWVLTLNIWVWVYRIFNFFLLFSNFSLFSSLLLCLFLKLLVQIIEDIKVIANIKRSISVDNWIMRLSLDHCALVINLWLRRILNTHIKMSALDINNITNYMMLAGKLSVLAIFLNFLAHWRIWHLRSCNLIKILKKVWLCHSSVTKMQFQMIIVSAAIEKLLMIFTLRCMIFSSLSH